MLQDSTLKTEIIDGSGKNMDLIAGGGGFGWQEKWGQEIIAKEILPRLKPDDIVIDLCSGEGRISMPFTMKGAEVILIDVNKERIEDGDKIRTNAGLQKVERIIEDVQKLNKEQLNGGGTILLAGDSLNHFMKKDADKFINEIHKLLNPNKRGLVYINVPSIEDSIFQYPDSYGATRLDKNTLEIECDCSGEWKKEPLPGYKKGELQTLLALQGANIISSNELKRNGGSILYEVIAEFKPKNNKEI